MARWNRYANAQRLGYRSGLEVQAAHQLEDAGVDFEYESSACKFTYYKPARNTVLIETSIFEESVLRKGCKIYSKHMYTCDFWIGHLDLFIETKGRFTASDRAKHAVLKAQYPDVDLRMIFTGDSPMRDLKSNLRPSEWCEKNGISYHIVPSKDKKQGIIIPKEWLSNE